MTAVCGPAQLFPTDINACRSACGDSWALPVAEQGPAANIGRNAPHPAQRARHACLGISCAQLVLSAPPAASSRTQAAATAQAAAAVRCAHLSWPPRQHPQLRLQLAPSPRSSCSAWVAALQRHRFSRATPARAESMCLPQPTLCATGYTRGGVARRGAAGARLEGGLAQAARSSAGREQHKALVGRTLSVRLQRERSYDRRLRALQPLCAAAPVLPAL